MSRPLSRPGLAAEAGFTLVELLFAMVVLVIGLLAMLAALGGATRYQSLAGARAEMALLAEAKFEQLRTAASSGNADMVQLAIGGSITTPTAPQTDVVVAPSGRRHTRLWAVTAGPVNALEVNLRIRPVVDEPRVPARLDFTTIILPR